MPVVAAIASPANPFIRDIARRLEERTHLLLEGEKAILDAVAAGIVLEHVLHDESVRPGRLAALTAAHPRLVSRAVLERLADSRTPQHLLAVARRRDVPVADVLAREGPIVFAFGVQDPGNLGAIVRVVEAAGGAGVIAAPGTADFFHPRAVRGSADPRTPAGGWRGAAWPAPDCVTTSSPRSGRTGRCSCSEAASPARPLRRSCPPSSPPAYL